MESVNAVPFDAGIDQFDVSDHWIRVFHVAAREGSFTAAARRLGVGQPSVSHAIAQLERRLGTDLFDRSCAPVRLTAAGRRLWAEVAPAFDRIDQAIAAERTDRRALTLSVSTSFATWWLLPRLSSFKAKHPDIELRCITSDSDAQVGRDDADLWIPHGPGPWPGLEERPLVPERIAAVAAPEVAARLPEPDSPAAVLDVPLLHLEERYQPRFDWRDWCRAKVVETASKSAMVSNDYAVVVQAALDGQGVALGWLHIVSSLLDAGRLVRLGGDPIETDAPFVMVNRPDHRADALDPLRRWLTAAIT